MGLSNMHVHACLQSYSFLADYKKMPVSGIVHSMDRGSKPPFCGCTDLMGSTSMNDLMSPNTGLG